jgi:hypothetical protein
MNHFYGFQKKHSYFEGWYLKHQSSHGTLALIPAYHINRCGKRSASLQVITEEKSYNIPFPVNQFYSARDMFYVNLGESVFSAQGIHLDIHTPKLTLTGDITYGPFAPPDYDIMGPFHYVPFMQCHHGILSLSHRIKGQVTLNGAVMDFGGGLGYIEKDRGSSFPSDYLWSQCSWADKTTKTPCSIMVALANIPMGPAHFTGCISSVYFHGKEYRLATYLGVRILKYTDREVVIRQGKYTLHVNLIKEQPHCLAAPSYGSMTRTIRESVGCQVRYRFYIKDKKVFDILCRHAGFERGDLAKE